MHFYAIDYSGLLALPIYTFWELARNVDRIRAEEDRRMMQLISNAIMGDGGYYKNLTEQMGEVITVSEETFDRKGFENLRQIMAFHK
jgi:hypothetical protein